MSIRKWGQGAPGAIGYGEKAREREREGERKGGNSHNLVKTFFVDEGKYKWIAMF